VEEPVNVNANRAMIAARPVPVFEFQDLAALPCGCVTAAYCAIQWGVSLVSLEAKGPHCTLANHFHGQVLSLGDMFEDALEEEGEG
jgi:hypothetical protein